MPLKAKLLVLSSTYRRWPEDTLPDFVHQLSRRMTINYEVHVLAPHCKYAKMQEIIEDVTIHRYRYAPLTWQCLAYEGGMMSALQKNKFLWLLVPFFLFFQFHSALKIIRREKISLLHAHWILPQGLVLWALKKIKGKKLKALLTVHGGDLYSFDSIIGRKLKKAIINQADSLTIVSSSMKVKLAEISPGTQGRIASMGVDLRSVFTLNENVERKYIVFVGRFVDKKGVLTLIEAYARARKLGLEEKLLLVGDGPLFEAVQNKVIEKSLQASVILVGAQSQGKIPAYFQQAKLVVVPSEEGRSGDREGLGLVLVEALACGAPVLISDEPAFEEVVGAQSDIFRFPAGNMESLCEYIIKIMDDYEGYLNRSLRIREGLMNKFDWKVVADNYLDIIGGIELIKA